MFRYHDLKVWQLSMDLADRIYEVTTSFPHEERFGLTAQLRRCSVSVPSNIAEGHSRDSTLDFLRFLSISKGSLAEMETQLQLACRREYLSAEELHEIQTTMEKIGKMLSGLQSSLRRKLAET